MGDIHFRDPDGNRYNILQLIKKKYGLFSITQALDHLILREKTDPSKQTDKQIDEANKIIKLRNEAQYTTAKIRLLYTVKNFEKSILIMCFNDLPTEDIFKLKQERCNEYIKIKIPSITRQAKDLKKLTRKDIEDTKIKAQLALMSQKIKQRELPHIDLKTLKYTLELIKNDPGIGDYDPPKKKLK